MSLGTHELYEFGAYRLDVAERRLLRDGTALPLTPKAFDTLLALVRHAGRLVSKDELLSTVWPDVAVEEATLAQNISTLRKALGEAPGEPQYIETVPKSGYRFVASVRRVTPAAPETVAAAAPARGEPPAGQPSVRRWPWPLIGALVVVAIAAVAVAVMVRSTRGDRPRTLAIVPFRNLQPAADTDYLGPSLADALATRLAELPQIVVRPSSYTQRYAREPADPRQVASEVSADTVLMGTFLREGNTLRVTAELIDIDRGDVLWRDTLDVEYDRLLAVQDRVARRVVEELNVRLSPAQAARFARGGPRDARAYELYLRGLQYRAENKWGQGIAVMEESVAQDPTYAPAWVNLGWLLYGHGFFQGGGEQYTQRALAAFDRALALDPQSHEALIAKGMYYLESGRVEEAAPVLRQVVRLNPSSAMGRWWLGYAYRYAGLLQESLREADAAFRLDPHVGRGTSTNTFLYVGDHQRFLETLPTDESARTAFYRGLGLLYGNDRTGAAREFHRAYQLDPSLVHARVGKGMRHVLLGERREALQELRRIEELDRPRDGEMLYKVAQAYALAEAPDHALRVLAEAIEQDFVCVPYFERDVLLASIRGDRRFAQLLERANERQRELRAAFEM